jgi:hypothetical protein
MLLSVNCIKNGTHPITGTPLKSAVGIGYTVTLSTKLSVQPFSEIVNDTAKVAGKE